jgi:hypothetical protein
MLMLKERMQPIAGYRLTFQQFEIPDREAMMRGEGPMIAQAIIHVTAPDGTTTTVKPALEVEGDKEPVSEPISLPGGATATLMQVDPANQIALVKIGGVDLSTVRPEDLKARAFIEVSYEPGIKLVWAGIIIAVLGGLLALIRRWLEGSPTWGVAVVPQPMPRPNAPVPHTEPALAPMLPNSEVG